MLVGAGIRAIRACLLPRFATLAPSTGKPQFELRRQRGLVATAKPVLRVHADGIVVKSAPFARQLWKALFRCLFHDKVVDWRMAKREYVAKARHAFFAEHKDVLQRHVEPICARPTVKR